MEKIGSYEAKTHLPQLLKRVAKGETIIITKHGIPVATLQAPETGTGRQRPKGEVVADLRQFRRTHRLDGVTILEMIGEGRR
jgi:prevent-host-death family protein